MKILLTGSNGQLSNELQSIIKKGYSEIGAIEEEISKSEIIAVDIDSLDITKINEVRSFLNTLMPDIVINCAAYTNVDKCEIDKDNAYKVNAIGPKNLAIICEEIGAKLIHVSTDYVFNGESRDEPLREYDIPDPKNIYGKTKLQGEEYVSIFSTKYFIIRTSWLYGYKGNNFVYTMMNLGKNNDSLKVVNDQTGNPTNANDLAHHILKIAITDEYGIYHCTGEGECTWYDFAKKIMEYSNIQCTIIPCSSEEYVRAAKRPKYSSLDNMMLRCTVKDEMRNWEEALKRFIENVEVSKRG